MFLDTETTGLGEDAEIIDIAIIDRHGRVLIDTLVRPSDIIPPEVTAIHGLDDPAVADAPTWDNVYPLVGRILDQYGPVVVYNAEFDARVIEQTNRLYGLPSFSVDWHCAMKQYAAYAGVWHDRYGTWRWHKLVEARRMMGRPAPDFEHRARSDAEACRQIVEAMAAGVVPAEPLLPEPSQALARVESEQPRDEPLQPEIITPGDRERFGDDPRGWETRSGSFPGGQYTVISTRTRGCSSGALLAILIGGMIVIGLGCCLFFYLFAMWI